MFNSLRLTTAAFLLATGPTAPTLADPIYQELQVNQKISSADTTVSVEATDSSTKAKKSNVHYGVGLIATGTTNDEIPFWMRSNQYGNVPTRGASLGLAGQILRDYSTDRKKRLFDWGTTIDARINLGKKSEVILIEAYAKVSLGIFQLKAGRSRDIMGLVDSTLSSGSFSVSGNSLGIPKVELSIPEFWSIPFLWNVVAVKGNFAHGWLGEVGTRTGTLYGEATAYFHQKSLYARFGRPEWKVNLFAGFNHQAFWGDERKINGPKYKLSPWETYKRVIFGESYGGNDIGLPRSKVGNHLGSIDQGIEVRAGGLKFFGYHQFFYDVGGLYHLSNVKDGLFGLSVVNERFADSESTVRWKKFLIEYIATKSQGGEIDAKITPSGDEDYYNNFIYQQGWSYKGENLGNPLITNVVYARKELPAQPREYFVNNRLKAIQLGTEYAIASWNFIMKLNYSLNFGTYGTSPWGHSLNYIRIPSKPPFFGEERQFSGYVTANRSLKANLNIALTLAVDQGTMLYNSSGLSLKISKYW